jgi:Zn-dependent protease
MPTCFQPSGLVVWRRNRLVLHASGLLRIAMLIGTVIFLVWSKGQLKEPLCIGVAVAVVWNGVVRVALHEASHAVIGKRVGFEFVDAGIGRQSYVRMRAPAGGNAPRAWALMAAAGPASELVMVVLLGGSWVLLGANVRSNVAMFFFCTASWHTLSVIVNLLPFRGHDGSTIMQALLAGRRLRGPVVARAVGDNGYVFGVLGPDDKDEVLAMCTDEVIRHDLLGNGYREQLSATFSSDIVELKHGVPTRLGIRLPGDPALIAYVLLVPFKMSTEKLAPGVQLSLWTRAGVSPDALAEILKSSVIWLHTEARFDAVVIGTVSDEEDAILTAVGLNTVFAKAVSHPDGTTRTCNFYTSFSPEALQRIHAKAAADLGGDIGA